jgi:hypothetical protein
VSQEEKTLTKGAVSRQNRRLFMNKALLAVLPLFLVSCKSVQDRNPNDPRPSSELTDYTAPQTNKGLAHGSKFVGQAATSSIDVTEDTLDGSGKIVDRQARDYTGIGLNAVRRGDNIVYREANRYSDYAMDTTDEAAQISGGAAAKYPGWIARLLRRGTSSSSRVVRGVSQGSGAIIDAGVFGVVDLISPPEPKNYMVGSLQDQYPAGNALPGSGWKGRPPELPADNYSMASGGRASATK